MVEQFSNKVALVTGGGSGIGRATALAFAREGARVVVADIVAASGAETVHQIEAAGGEAMFVQVDVSQAAEVEAMISRTVDAYGRLDCAFNNAGIADGRGTIPELPEEVWQRVIAINLTGVYLCMKYEIPQMLRQSGGCIVNTSSAYGLVGARGNAAYGASKHGVVGLTKAAALEWAQQGIRVNAVCPGWIRTPMIEPISPEKMDLILSMEPIGRMGTPEEVAGAVLWLCSDAASFMAGHALAVDGGAVAQ